MLSLLLKGLGCVFFSQEKQFFPSCSLSKSLQFIFSLFGFFLLLF